MQNLLESNILQIHFLSKHLLSQEDEKLYKWLEDNNIIAKEKNYAACKWSIFEGMHFDICKLLVLMKEWLLGSSLHRCAIESGMDLTNLAVDWANFLWYHCRKFVSDLYYDSDEKLQGEIEIDKSLFDRRTKYHRGDPRGLKVDFQDGGAVI